MAERDAHHDGFVLGQEPVRRRVAVAPDPDLQRRSGAQVVHPVGTGSPRRTDHNLAGIVIVGQNHGDGVIALARRASDVGESEEPAPEQPPPPSPIEAKRHPEHNKGQAPRNSPKPQPTTAPASLHRRGGSLHSGT